MPTSLHRPEYQSRTLVYFAVGGSGIRTVEPLLYLCAAGLGPRTLKLILADADQGNAAVTRIRGLINAYNTARETAGNPDGNGQCFGTEVQDPLHSRGVWSPIAEDQDVANPAFGAKVGRPLMTGQFEDAAILCDLLFGRRLQDMDLSWGFRGIPALGSVFMHRVSDESFFKQLIIDSRVETEPLFFASGSVFGGTGAAALPVIGRALLRGVRQQENDVPGIPQQRLGAALLMPYFTLPSANSDAARDGGPRPMSEAFAQNTAAAIPTYTSRQAGYGGLYFIGDDQPRQQRVNEVGGPAQANTAHYAEFFAALAALDFCARNGEQTGTLPQFRMTTIGSEPSWADLPLDATAQLKFAGSFVAAHTLLKVFRPNGARGDLWQKFKGVTWAQVLEFGEAEFDGLAPEVDALAAFYAAQWDWAGELANDTPRLMLCPPVEPTRLTTDQCVAGRRTSTKTERRVADDWTVFRAWNLEARRVIAGTQPRLAAILQRGSERFAREWFADPTTSTGSSNRRNLLPRLRATATIPVGTIGDWNTVQSPEQLARIEFENTQTRETVRLRIQSIPSPWSRMLLFKNALELPEHPAHAGLRTELEDGLEFLWSYLERTGQTVSFRLVRLDDLRARLDRAPDKRIADFLESVLDSVPLNTSGQPAFSEIVATVVNGRPIIGSSPFTVLFTSEDAADSVAQDHFQFMKSGKLRPLADRRISFSIYIGNAILPQLQADIGTLARPDSPTAIVYPWLNSELQQCIRQKSSEQSLQSLQGGLQSADRVDAWAANAGLQRVSQHEFGGLTLFCNPPGRALERSRWRLNVGSSSTTTPLVLIPSLFDGYYYEGASRTVLPSDLAKIDRATLPVTNEKHAWILPENDWFADRLLLLNNPINRAAVLGYNSYEVHDTRDAKWSRPRALLPLKAEFFRWFSPKDVDKMLRLTVDAQGAFTAELTLPLGPDAQHVTISKSYMGATILAESGPDISVWPGIEFSNAGLSWKNYVVFRRDADQLHKSVFRIHAFAGGAELELTSLRKTPLVECLNAAETPHVLEVRATPTNEQVGVLLPAYSGVEFGTDQKSWFVGIDFGTSNTVIGLRSDTKDDAEYVFSADSMRLDLTHAVETTAELLDAYFLPTKLEPQPFGTAILHTSILANTDITQEPLAQRTTIPFTGFVDRYEEHRVRGDLKWSSDPHDHFLSLAFLRHLLATVIAGAARLKIHPKQLRFRWAYPRAFTPQQINDMRSHWQTAVRQFAFLGMDPSNLAETDESRSVLNFFFNKEEVGTVGKPAVIVDVGGGTSDIAAYGEGKVVFFDSVLFGGRNLTGRKLRNGENSNPFVSAFVDWAMTSGNFGFSPVLEKYREDGEPHLAFTYLVRSKWFEEGNAALFRAHDAYKSFRAITFYFYSALFYYVGLHFRTLGNVAGPHRVILAGNGSRYLDWLADLQHQPQASKPFLQSFAQILADAAGGVELPEVKVSTNRKEEVARGLVAGKNPALNESEPVRNASIPGEALIQVAADGSREVREGEPFGYPRPCSEAELSNLRLANGPAELMAFHEMLSVRASKLVHLGPHYAALPDIYESVFRTHLGRSFESDILNSMQLHASRTGGFQGSVFLWEAAHVIDRMFEELF